MTMDATIANKLYYLLHTCLSGALKSSGSTTHFLRILYLLASCSLILKHESKLITIFRIVPFRTLAS
jgi:hypothetical protein